MNCHLKILSVLVLSAWNWPVSALDLGKLQITSAIGEALRAEVDIAQASPDELRSLRARLAAPESFHQAGMEYNPALAGVSASLQTRSNGSPFIALSGKTPIQENFIDLILETQWAGGRLVKNYALLLNSVNDRASAPNPTVTSSPRSTWGAEPASQLTAQRTPATRPSPTDTSSTLNPVRVELNAQKVPVYTFAPVDNIPPSAKESVVAIAPSKAPVFKPMDSASAPKSVKTSAERGGNTIAVQAGDTASTLAMRHLAAHVSLDQMLLAMLNANPDAFIQGNVNLVKAGAVLKVPTPDEATQISRSEARQTVMAQTRDFADYARRLAESPLLVGSKKSRELTGKVTLETPDAPSALPQQDKLTLSKSKAGADNAEAKLAAEREAKDAAEQLEALNKNLKDLQVLAQGPTPSTTDMGTGIGAATTPLAAASASAATVAPLATDSTQPSSSQIKTLSESKNAWLWGAAALAVLLMVAFLMRKKSRVTDDVYAPSYNDTAEPPLEAPAAHSMKPSDLSAQMASIDLNLAPQDTGTPSPGVAPANPVPTAPVVASSEETELSKLTLATQLLAQGDHNLARALILSVASTATGDLKSRAFQMLGQLR